MEIVEEAFDVSEVSVPITPDVENLSEEGSVKSMEVRGDIESHHQPPTPITPYVEILSEEGSVKSMEVRGDIESHHQPPTPITPYVENLSEEASVKSMEARGDIESHHQPPTPSAVVGIGNREENASFAAIIVKKLTKFFEHKGWVEEGQGTLLLLSSVIAVFCFQNLLNPPGGLRQQTSTNPDDGECSKQRPCYAGTALLGNSRWSSYTYSYFSMLNTICFCTCQTINLLICSGFPTKHRMFMFILLMLMCACLVMVSIMFMILTWLVMPEGIHSEAMFSTFTWLKVWGGMIMVIFAFHIIRMPIWCVKTVKGCKIKHL